MKRNAIIAMAVFLFLSAGNAGAAAFPQDILHTSSGELVVAFVGHGTLILSFAGKVIHVDPWGRLADYSSLPDADLILVTHEHFDHFDAKAIDAVRKPDTVILTNQAAAQHERARVVSNGEKTTAAGILIEAVPAYNIVHKNEDGTPFHPRGQGNGYVLTFGDKRVYVAGDTENIPEMRDLGRIDVAFMPVNLPYTMTPEMLAEAARMVRPAILYPYHYGDTNTDRIVEALRGIQGPEVRMRPMK